MIQDEEYWEQLYQEYKATEGDPQQREQLERRIRVAMQSRQNASLEWLINALQDEEKKWLVLLPLRDKTIYLPPRLVAAILLSAVYESDLEKTRYYVLPCLRLWGPRRVTEALLEVLEHGADDEKAGAANALYWARHGGGRKGPGDEALADLWQRRRVALLREYVTNPDEAVRQSIGHQLNLDPDAYPEESHSLLAEAREMAAASGQAP